MVVWWCAEMNTSTLIVLGDLRPGISCGDSGCRQVALMPDYRTSGNVQSSPPPPSSHYILGFWFSSPLQSVSLPTRWPLFFMFSFSRGRQIVLSSSSKPPIPVGGGVSLPIWCVCNAPRRLEWCLFREEHMSILSPQVQLIQIRLHTLAGEGGGRRILDCLVSMI